MQGFHESQFGKSYESESFKWNMWDPNFYFETRLYASPIENSNLYIKFYPDKDNINPSEEILPSEGLIVIFPADRYHSVIYDGTKDRMIIGDNFYSI